MKEVGEEEEKIQPPRQPRQLKSRRLRALSLHRPHQVEPEPFAVIQMVFIPMQLIVKNTTSVLMELHMSTLALQELFGMMT